jgi:ubiquinol-cytochrome c reductase cytochrome c subunit
MGEVEPVPERLRGSARLGTPHAPRRLAFVVLAAAATLVVAVVLAQAAAGAGSAAPAGNAQAGASVFAGNCAPCHGPKGQGQGLFPTLAAAGFPSLVSDKVQVGGGGMPSFLQKPHILSPTAIADVSAYVAQDLADPASHAAGVSQGGVVYRLYCGGCHSASGRGGAIVNGVNAPSLQTMPPANALAAMVLGPSNMPVFTGTLDVTQQTSVARYIEAALHGPPSPGGLPLGSLGPVTEGIVSWLALVVLILIAVWLAWKGGAARERT